MVQSFRRFMMQSIEESWRAWQEMLDPDTSETARAFNSSSGAHCAKLSSITGEGKPHPTPETWNLNKHTPHCTLIRTAAQRLVTVYNILAT
jgi:hypothetical protein